MKRLILILGIGVLATVARAADDHIAAIDGNLIKMLYGPVTTTNAVSSEGWIHVYISASEYASTYAAIKNKPPEQQLVSYLPAAKVTAARNAAKDYEADPDHLTDKMLKAVVKALVKIGNQKWRNGNAVTAAEVKTAIKSEL